MPSSAGVRLFLLPRLFGAIFFLTPYIQSRGCYKLTSVTIPKSVTKIWERAFDVGYI